MKLSHPISNKPNKIYHNVAEKLAPVVTLNAQLQRVKEWTQKYHSQPASNQEKRPVATAIPLDLLEDTIDLDQRSQSEYSELVVEGVKLMDTRDHHTAPVSPSPKEVYREELVFDNTAAKSDSDFDNHDVEQIGKEFLKARSSPKPYVQEFEAKINQKKFFESAIFNTFPYIRPKGGPKGRKLIPTTSKIPMTLKMANQAHPPEEDQELWRDNMKRSIPFTMKYSTDPGTGSSGQNQSGVGPVIGDDWSEKPRENDKDWWKWKLKQRFMENDELLQKLVDQRQKLESSLVKPGDISEKFPRDIGKIPSSFPSAVPSVNPFSRNSSRHITVEFGQGKNAELAGARITMTKVTKPGSRKSTRDPIPNFYAPSTQVLRAIMSGSLKPSEASRLYPPKKDTAKMKQQKLKTLKEDPYLAKLLDGNEMFKPEVMLEANQPVIPREELSHHHHHHYVREHGNLRRKMSLQSMSDSSDADVTAANFFNPDVKVLYERVPDVRVSSKEESTRKLYVAL